MKEGNTTRVSYDAAGNPISLTDALGVTTEYSYDVMASLLETLKKINGGTVRYGYDEIGSLVALTYPGDEIVRYTYFKNGWLHIMTDLVKFKIVISGSIL